MNIRIGCDVVHLPRFESAAQQPGFLQRVFTVHELTYAATISKLAGMFAIKESVAKALGIVPPPWQRIEIFYQHGRPCVRVLESEAHVEVTVAHDGDYVIAQALVYGDTLAVHSEQRA